MVSDHNPSVRSLDSAPDYVEYLLSRDASTTTLIVCSTRDAFLQQLYTSIAPTAPGAEQPSSPQNGHHGDSHKCSHRRLFNTIGSIARAKRLTLAFCPSLEHFRAYISVFRCPQLLSPQQECSHLSYRKRPVLAVLGLVSLHYDTSQFSAQGIAKNLALAVEIAAREMVDLTLCECVAVGREGASGSSLWDADVPLLSGQTLATVTGGNSANLGRTVKVKQVAKRWFYFV
ncbi:conserved hypothetical protein [Histoplasma capsulatum var. duboisii H88]|uniref:Uncharacterized protein n=2 Tax=Ajellomyces capsulatus TaxID=5037 RepID=F0UMW7_AJEC8|nr:conserved hypothetical protein [Histoplasma capsulatum H143]EGC47434.1 conserved hypothetical protein [Histoplasma capsulatum var. duboisii H88]QSS53609.1 hypothetical protein I7I53_00915 [Histoplasma capsulatum var. duboisii H88]